MTRAVRVELRSSMGRHVETVDDLFTDTGELRLWEDPVGWTGSVREIVDDSPWDHDAMNASHEVEYWREA